MTSPPPAVAEIERRLVRVQRERERLRTIGAPPRALDENRLDLVRCFHELARAFVREYAAPELAG